MAVLLAGHEPDLAKVKAWVRLSAHTTTLPAVDVVAAVATVPATSAPATKAMVTFIGVRVIFMSRSSLLILSNSCDSGVKIIRLLRSKHLQLPL